MFARGTATDIEEKMQIEAKPFSELDDKLEIYRVMPLNEFYTMILSKQNVLLQPALWEDPYEKLLMNSTFSYRGKSKEVMQLKWQNWCGQCWSCSKESDAIWRSFTQSKMIRSVKLKTTVCKLRNAYSKSQIYEMFIYKVAYTSKDVESYQKTLQKWIDFLVKEDDDEKVKLDKVAMAFLLTKRNAFDYEDEVRLLQHFKFDNVLVQNTTSTVGVKDMEWIEEIEIDPWAKSYEKRNFNSNLELMGVDKKKIKDSELYNDIDLSKYQFSLKLK